MDKIYNKKNRNRNIRFIAIIVASIMLSSATLVFLGTDEAAAAPDYSYIVSKNTSGKTVVKSAYGYTAYSSSTSNKAIQWAIDHSASGKTVLINAGTYALMSGLTMKRGVTLSGVGDNTVLRNGEIDVFTSNVVIQSLRMEGTCHILIASKRAAISNIVVQDVSATTGVTPEVFSVKAATYKVSYVKFIRDTVTNSAANGFTINGEGPVSDILFDSCKAISNGLTNRPNDWVVGFALDGSNSLMQNVKMVNCEASYSWESGFFLSPSISKTGVVLQDCVANYNGQKPNAQEGYGYLLDSSVSMIDSTGVGNKGGLTNLQPAPQPVEKKESTMTITVPSSSINTGSSMVASGVLSSESSSGSVLISGATVRLSVKLPDGTNVNPVEGSTAVTDLSGRFTMSYAPATAGTVTFAATFDGDGSYDGTSASVSFTAVAPAPQKTASSVTLTLASSNVETGSSLHADGVLKGSSPIPDATVSLAVTLPDGNTANPEKGATAVTDAYGRFSMDYVPSTAGTYKFTATFGGNEQYIGSSTSASFNVVAPTPTPTTTYDYIVSNNVVKGPTGSTAYTGSSFTAALNWACTQTGRVVYVPAGSYSLSDNINFASGVTLMGDGAMSTVFTFTTKSMKYADYSDASFHVKDVDGVTLKQFGITGQGCVRLSSTSGTHGGHVVQDVTVWDTNYMVVNAFGTWVSRGTGASVNDIKFIRCVAYNVGGNGFAIMGNFPWSTGTAGTQHNIYFEDCKALYCGYTNDIWDWTVGFDLVEQCHIDKVTLVRCEASYNWESGFHLEYGPTVTDCVFQDCVANYNGQSYSDPRGAVWGAGYLTFGYQDVTKTRCTGIGNAGGTFYSADRYPVEQKTVSGYGYTYSVSGTTVKNTGGTTVYTGSSFTTALQWACSQANAVVRIPGGTYSVTGQITLASGVCLYGGIDLNEWFSSPGSPTILNFPGTSADEGFAIHNVDNVRMNLLRINNGNVEITADGGDTVSNIKLRGLIVNEASSLHPAAIYSYCASGSTIDGLDIGACEAKAAHTDGFRFAGAGSSTNAWLKNLKLTCCNALSCGQTSPRYGDSVGFRLGEGVNIQTVTVVGCDAEYSYCSGFYFSTGSQISGSLTDCEAQYNGQKGDTANGAGYQLNGYPVTMTNCVGTGNIGPLVRA